MMEFQLLNKLPDGKKGKKFIKKLEIKTCFDKKFSLLNLIIL